MLSQSQCESVLELREPAPCVLDRWDVAERAVEAVVVVDIPTISQHHLELEPGVELLAVQEPVAEPAVEALDVGVLPRSSRDR